MIIAIMPAHNEEKTIARVIKETKKYVDRVIVVNDASTDNTAAVAEKAGAVVIRHEKNKGLGGSLRSGFKEALKISKKNNDIIITIDADGQHEPKEIPNFVKKLREGYDFVLGERNLKKYPLRKKIGNKFLTAATNIVSKTDIKDTESGYRAFMRQALSKLRLKAERYEIAAEIIYEVGRNKLKTTNIPIRVPVYVQGVGVCDGIKNFWYILKK
jgi:dolichol-phosphate mannosyltransferase